MAKRHELAWLALASLVLALLMLAVPALADVATPPVVPTTPPASDDLTSIAEQIFKLFAGTGDRGKYGSAYPAALPNSVYQRADFIADRPGVARLSRSR